MFTGIVEEKGYIKNKEKVSENAVQLTIAAKQILTDVQIGDSISVNGICLTVNSLSNDWFIVEVMPETMRATSLNEIQVHTPINLERAMQVNGRFGGHFVTGHIDYTGEIVRKEQVENAIIYEISVPEKAIKYFIEKGSVAIDGVSLTIFNINEIKQTITISLIPHTVSMTVLGDKQTGNIVNIESDVLAKLVEKQLQGGK